MYNKINYYKRDFFHLSFNCKEIKSITLCKVSNYDIRCQRKHYRILQYATLLFTRKRLKKTNKT